METKVAQQAQRKERVVASLREALSRGQFDVSAVSKATKRHPSTVASWVMGLHLPQGKPLRALERLLGVAR